MGDVTLADYPGQVERQARELLQAVQAVTQGSLETAFDVPESDLLPCLDDLAEGVRCLVDRLRDAILEQAGARAEAERARHELEAALAQAQAEQQTQFRRQWADYVDDETIPGAPPAMGREKGWLPVMTQAVVGNGTVSAVDPQEGATLAVPLQLYGEVLGAVGFCREESRPWSGEEVGAVETVLEQVALALESQRLFDEEQRARALLAMRVKELDCLNDIGRKIDEVPPVDEFLQWMTERVPVALQYPELCQVAIELEDRVYGAPSAAHFPNHMVQSLIIGGQRLGRVVVAYSQDRPFLDEESSLLGDIARRAAGYVENRRLFEQTRAALAESEMLLRVAQATTQLSDIDEMYGFVLTEYLRVLGLPQGGMLIHDEDGTWGTLRALVREGKLVEPGMRVPIGGNPPMERLMATKEPVIIDDSRLVDAKGVVRDLADELGYRSLLLVPIVTRGVVVGTLGADSIDQAHSFTPHEVALVQSVANQLAITIENRRLLQETQAALADTQALYYSAQLITSSASLPETLQSVVEGVAEALPAERVVFYILDMERQQVTNFVKGGSGAADIGPVDYQELMAGLSGWVLRELKPALSIKSIADPRESPDVRAKRLAHGTGSIVCVPVLYRGQVLGTITAMNGLNSPDFDQRDVDLVTGMANQAAAALENTRLLEETRQRAEELGLLNRVSLELAQEQQDLETLLQKITQRTMELLDSDGGGVWLWRENDQQLELVVSYQAGGADLARRRVGPGEGLAGRAFAEQTLKVVDDYCSWIGRSPSFEDAPFKSVVAVPMTWRGQAIGVLAASRSEAGRPYSLQNQDLAQLAAAQASAVIQNAFLLEEARRRAEEQAILGRVGQELAACQDEGSVLARVYDGAREVLGARDFYITFYDEESGQSVFGLRVANGQVTRPAATFARATSLAGRRVARGGLTDHLLRTRRPLLLSDRVGERLQDLGLTAVPLRTAVPASASVTTGEHRPWMSFSWLGVPLILGERVLGTMVALSYTGARAYDEHSQELFVNLANQVTLALQNVRSLAEARTALAEVETTHRSYVRRGWQEYLRQHQLLEDSGFVFDAFASLGTGQGDQVDTLAAAGEMSAVPGLWRPEMKQALLAGMPSRSPKARSASAASPTKTNARSGLAVPITLRGQTLGVLGVEAPEGEREWSEEDLALVQAVSEQLAQTLETARLFADTQQTAERERLIGEITAKVRASSDIRDILKTTAAELSRALGTSRALVRLGFEAPSADTQSSAPDRSFGVHVPDGSRDTTNLSEEEPCLD